MSVDRTTSVRDDLHHWAEEFTLLVEGGVRSVRIQWDIEGHTDPLTLYANKTGTFIVEAGQKPMPADEWLTGTAA